MEDGKMQTLEGIARKHEKEAFLNAATCHVRETVEDTIMRWKADGMTGMLR